MVDQVGLRDKAIGYANEACKLDKEKRYENALAKYIQAIEYFNLVIKCIFLSYPLDEPNKSLKETLKEKAEQYLDRAMQIKEFIKNNEETQENSADNKENCKRKA